MALRILKEKNTISFILTGDITGNDLVLVIHNIELLCQEHSDAAVLFETTDLKTYDFLIDLKDFDIYKKYKMRLKKIAIVHKDKMSPFIADKFLDFKKTKIQIFRDDQIEKAREWISV